MSVLDVWYAAERATLGDGPAGKLMLGGVVYGKWFLEIFARYCLPTILARANREALQATGTVIALYTDEETSDDLIALLQRTRAPGIRSMVRQMSEEVMKADMRLFLRLAAAQSLLVQRAAQHGMAFHMLMPDHLYDERYFPNLLRVATTHPNIAHAGMNVAAPAALREIEVYRQRDGSLAVPAKDLATIGWRNTVMCAMNGCTPDRMPDEHYHVWRAQDRVMLFNPYANPAHISPQVGRLMDEDGPTTGTLDTHVQRLFGADFYAPKMSDGMAFLAMSDAQPVPANNFTTLDKLVDRAWSDIGCQYERVGYYTTPTEMPASIDESAPTAGEVIDRQQRIVDRITAKRMAA